MLSRLRVGEADGPYIEGIGVFGSFIGRSGVAVTGKVP